MTIPRTSPERPVCPSRTAQIGGQPATSAPAAQRSRRLVTPLPPSDKRRRHPDGRTVLGAAPPGPHRRLAHLELPAARRDRRMQAIPQPAHRTRRLTGRWILPDEPPSARSLYRRQQQRLPHARPATYARAHRPPRFPTPRRTTEYVVTSHRRLGAFTGTRWSRSSQSRLVTRSAGTATCGRALLRPQAAGLRVRQSAATSRRRRGSRVRP
jgi:hypothetical protein